MLSLPNVLMIIHYQCRKKINICFLRNADSLYYNLFSNLVAEHFEIYNLEYHIICKCKPFYRETIYHFMIILLLFVSQIKKNILLTFLSMSYTCKT